MKLNASIMPPRRSWIVRFARAGLFFITLFLLAIHLASQRWEVYLYFGYPNDYLMIGYGKATLRLSTPIAKGDALDAIRPALKQQWSWTVRSKTFRTSPSLLQAEALFRGGPWWYLQELNPLSYSGFDQIPIAPGIIMQRGIYHLHLPILFVMSAFLTALLLLPWKRLPSGFCRSCGYNMRGNVSGRCPECGTPWTPDEDLKRPLTARLVCGRIFALLFVFVAAITFFQLGYYGGSGGLIVGRPYYSIPIHRIVGALGLVTGALWFPELRERIRGLLAIDEPHQDANR